MLFLGAGLDLDRLDQLAFVETAGSTDAMRQDERVAVLALGTGLGDQMVVSPAQRRSGVRMSSLRMCHDVAPYWISLFL